MTKESISIKGIIGGLIGGLIASLPWFLMYVYGNFIVAILAVPIALGVDFGYKKFGGKPNEKLPKLIMALTLIVVALMVTLIIPLFLITIKWGYSFDLFYLKEYYLDSFLAIMGDLAISLVFAFLGIGGVLIRAKQEAGLLEAGDDAEIKGETIDVSPYSSQYYKKQLEPVRAAFEELRALSKENAVSKTELREFLETRPNKALFNTARIQTVIRKSHGKYYFCEKAANSWLYRFWSVFSRIMFGVLIFTLGIILIIALNN